MAKTTIWAVPWLVATCSVLSCGNGAGGATYFIEATIDGATYRQTVYTECWFSSSIGTRMYASDSAANKANNVNKWYILVNGNAAGTYPGTQVIIKYYRTQTDFYEHNQGIFGTDSSVIITSYGNVGGVIEGTFSGELKYSADNTTKTMTNGSFRLLRNADQ